MPGFSSVCAAGNIRDSGHLHLQAQRDAAAHFNCNGGDIEQAIAHAMFSAS
jgi:hypothetical protein